MLSGILIFRCKAVFASNQNLFFFNFFFSFSAAVKKAKEKHLHFSLMSSNQFDSQQKRRKTELASSVSLLNKEEPSCVDWKIDSADVYRLLVGAFPKKRDPTVAEFNAAKANESLCNYAVTASRQYATKERGNPAFVRACYTKPEDEDDDDSESLSASFSDLFEEGLEAGDEQVLMFVYYATDGTLVPIAHASFQPKYPNGRPGRIDISIVAKSSNVKPINVANYRSLFAPMVARLAAGTGADVGSVVLAESNDSVSTAAHTMLDLKSDLKSEKNKVVAVALDDNTEKEEVEEQEEEQQMMMDEDKEELVAAPSSMLRLAESSLKNVFPNIDALYLQYKGLAAALAQSAVRREIFERTGKRIEHLSPPERAEAAKSIAEATQRYAQKLWPYDRRLLFLTSLSFEIKRAQVDAARRFDDGSAEQQRAVADEMSRVVRRLNEQQRVLFGAQQALKRQLAAIERAESTLVDDGSDSSSFLHSSLAPYVEQRGMVQLPSARDPVAYERSLRQLARALESRIVQHRANYFAVDFEAQAGAIVPGVLVDAVQAELAAAKKREEFKRETARAALLAEQREKKSLAARRSEIRKKKRKLLSSTAATNEDVAVNDEAAVPIDKGGEEEMMMSSEENNDDDEEKEDEEEKEAALAIDPRCLKPTTTKAKRSCVQLLREDGQMIVAYTQRGTSGDSLDDLTPSGRRDVVLRTSNPFAPNNVDDRWVVKFVATDADRELHRYLMRRPETTRYVVPLADGASQQLSSESAAAVTAATIVSGRFLGDAEWRPVKVTRFWHDSGPKPSESERRRGEQAIHDAMREFATLYPTLVDTDNNDWSTERNRINDNGHYRYYDFDCSTLPRRPGCTTGLGGGRGGRGGAGGKKKPALVERDFDTMILTASSPTIDDNVDEELLVDEDDDEEEDDVVDPMMDDLLPVVRYTIPSSSAAWQLITEKHPYNSGAVESATTREFTHRAAERFLADNFVTRPTDRADVQEEMFGKAAAASSKKDDNDDDDDDKTPDDADEMWRALLLVKKDAEENQKKNKEGTAAATMWLLFAVVRTAPSLRLLFLARGVAESNDPRSAVDITAYENASIFTLGAQSKLGKEIVGLVKKSV